MIHRDELKNENIKEIVRCKGGKGPHDLEELHEKPERYAGGISCSLCAGNIPHFGHKFMQCQPCKEFYCLKCL